MFEIENDLEIMGPIAIVLSLGIVTMREGLRYLGVSEWEITNMVLIITAFLLLVHIDDWLTEERIK